MQPQLTETVPPVLEFKDLTVDLYTDSTSVRAVDGVSIQVRPGEILAIVGESGSGKTVLTLGPLGLMPEGVSIDVRGTATCCGHDLIDTSGSANKALRSGQVGVIFQDPISALNPMKKIGPQLCKQAMRLRGLSRSEGKKVALDLLNRTGIPDPADRYNRYPHEMSGGMLQRAMIALALVGNPRVLIADEPTTAIDATVQAQILELIKNIQKSQEIAVILITHDIGVVSSVADRVVVLYAGRVAETGTVEQVLIDPVHPYTKGLLASVPDVHSRTDRSVEGIPGTPPDQSQLCTGCPFAPRCQYALEICLEVVPCLEEIGTRSTGHLVACHVAHSTTQGT